MKIERIICAILFAFIAWWSKAQANTKKIEVLIITGQNNHFWQGSSEMVKGIYNKSDQFNASIVTTPAKGEDMSAFKPIFSEYDVICLDYNGDSWPEETKTAFVNFIKKGGGLVLFHASDNAFPNWQEYNQMIGVGGWNGRNEKNGVIIYWENGSFKKDKSAGRGGAHGHQGEFIINTRKPDHPIMKGLPGSWLHTKDELYHSLRGPAKNMDVLATSKQNQEIGGSGRQEPVLMTIKYGNGRVFHTVLGHTSAKHIQSIKCAGFITTLLRGTEWVATGKVTQPLIIEFPDLHNTRVWDEAKPTY